MSTPIRVLLIAPSLDIVGGQAIQADRLLRSLKNQPELLVTFQPFNPRIGFLRRIKFVRTVATFWLYIVQLTFRVWRYDVLHVFTASYYSYSLWTLPALFIAKLYRKKIVVNYRDGQAEDHLRHWRSALPTIRMMDRVVAPSGYLVDVFAKFRVPAIAIFNVIETGDFKYRSRRKIRPVFLHNRALEPLYNVECTLRAFHLIQKRYPEARLTLAHDGPLRPALEALAKDLGLRGTNFIGQVAPARIAALYDDHDIYLTSPNFDCMPGSLLECFASGLPVVATGAGGIPYIAENECTALLVPCGDFEALAAAALRLLEDETLVERITSNAFDQCRRYSPEAVAQHWLALYQELMHSRYIRNNAG